MQHRPAALPAARGVVRSGLRGDRHEHLLNGAFFGWYANVALTVFLLGSLLRFDHSQYTWRTAPASCCAAGSCSGGRTSSTSVLSSSSPVTWSGC